MRRNPGLTNTHSSIATKLMTAFSQKLARLFLSLAALAASHSVNANYSTWQIESDLAQNPAFEQVISDDNLYAKSQYVDDLRSNNIVSLSDFHGWLKSLDVELLPKPSLVPVGVDGLPIFIPTYPVPKRVGDKFVQRVVVLDQLRHWLGSTVRWTGSSTLTEEQLIDDLYSSGKEYARLNGLVLGSPFPQDQWQASGHGDLIWPEFRVIYGQQVLVPIVYLTANTVNNYAVNDHITSPSNTTAVLNSLTIGASASMHIRNQVLQLMEGFYADGKVSVDKANERIVVGGTLDVHGGSITAEENLNIVAHAIALRPTVVLSDDRFGQSQVIGSLASVNAPNGSIKLSSYRLQGEDGSRTGNIYVEGAQVNGQSVELYAPDGNIDILAAQLRSTVDQVIPGGRYSRSEIDYVSSVISGEEAVSLIAGGEINIRASDLISEEGVVEILAGSGIYIENEFGMVQEQMHQKIGKTTTDMSQFQTTAIKANLKAGKGVHLSTDAGPIVLRSVDIDASEGTSLNAKNGQVHLLMAKEQDQYNYSRIKKSLLTIKSEVESWDQDTAIYNTIVGGLDVNATRGVVVEYAGKEGATEREQVQAMAELTGMAGMEWFSELQQRDCAAVHAESWSSNLTEQERLSLMSQQSCVDFGFVELIDEYDYAKKTNLSPAAMAVVSVAVAVATGGTGAAAIGQAFTGTTFAAGTVSAAVANAAFTTLVTQATQVGANGLLNGSSPYDIWKEMGSKENVRQLATAMATAGAMAYADDVMSLENATIFTEGAEKAGELNYLGQATQILAHTTVRTSLNVLSQGKSLSDFGSDFEDAFVTSLAQSVVQEIGKEMAGKIANAAPNDVSRYFAHAALGCVAQSATAENSEEREAKCYSGGAGAVLGEYLAEEQKASTDQELQEWMDSNILHGSEISETDMSRYMDELIAFDVDMAKLGAALTAFVMGGDVGSASAAAGIAAMYNANSDSDQRKKNVWELNKKIQLASGRVVYKYTDPNGVVHLKDTCPKVLNCHGTAGEALAKSPAELELERQKDEYNARKHQHWVDCTLKEIIPCDFNTSWGGSISEEAKQAVDDEWSSTPGQQKLAAVQAEYKRISDKGGDVASVACDFLSPCALTYEVSKVAESGELTTESYVAMATAAAGAVGFFVKRADDVVDANRILPGLGRAPRNPNPDYPPNVNVVQAMSTDRIRQMAACDRTDCSEVAEELFDSAGGVGDIIEVLPTTRYRLNVYENGKVVPDQWYHQVYTDGKYVYDPAVSADPIPKGDWIQHIKKINPEGVRISNKLEY